MLRRRSSSGRAPSENERCSCRYLGEAGTANLSHRNFSLWCGQASEICRVIVGTLDHLAAFLVTKRAGPSMLGALGTRLPP